MNEFVWKTHTIEWDNQPQASVAVINEAQWHNDTQYNDTEYNDIQRLKKSWQSV
jgi:hypothetical protein